MVCFTSGTDELVGCCCLPNEYVHAPQGFCQGLGSCRGNVLAGLRADIFIIQTSPGSSSNEHNRKKKDWHNLLPTTILNSKVASCPQMPFD